MDSTFLIKSLFNRANQKDLPSIKILQDSGENMGKSIAGVIAEINIKEPIQIILAGSVWAKATNNEMLKKFKEVVITLTKKRCDFIVLNESPVMGAILWALELANEKLPDLDLKNKVINSINNYQNSLIK
ncbi:MAG: ROK family protein [Bacilli bacterium]